MDDIAGDCALYTDHCFNSDGECACGAYLEDMGAEYP